MLPGEGDRQIQTDITRIRDLQHRFSHHRSILILILTLRVFIIIFSSRINDEEGSLECAIISELCTIDTFSSVIHDTFKEVLNRPSDGKKE